MVLPIDGLSNPKIPTIPSKTADDKALMDAAKQFEAIFLNEMFKQMRATVPEGGLLKESMGEQIFRSMLDEEIAKQAADQGGIGLADIIFKQLKAK